MFAKGSPIGPYQVTVELGTGGMGVVDRARDPRFARDVAIKALPEEFAHDPERVARFDREARLLVVLHHSDGPLRGILFVEHWNQDLPR